MEIILALAVIVVLCLIFNISTEYIVLGILALIELTIISMAILFLYSRIRLAFSKKKKAQFTRIDFPPSSKNRFKVAFYNIDGVEYPCFFPSEMILNDKMYRTDRTYTVMFSKSMKRVFDIWTILTCILGFICSTLAVFVSFWMFSFVM